MLLRSMLQSYRNQTFNSHCKSVGCNHGVIICRLFHILAEFSFTTSKRICLKYFVPGRGSYVTELLFLNAICKLMLQWKLCKWCCLKYSEILSLILLIHSMWIKYTWSILVTSHKFPYSYKSEADLRPYKTSAR